MWPKALCVLLLIHCCTCVIVKDGELAFSLADVKKLKDIFDKFKETHPRVQRDISEMDAHGICGSLKLPAAFLPVCAKPNAAQVFTRLGRIAQNPDICDVCALAACSGC
ncbi:guanylin-like [Pelobates fuscus]|uniref:guanylin-like n=1 Tax=Pelobates fuscus TaxID=191477 RepID=UPI002FE473F5